MRTRGKTVKMSKPKEPESMSLLDLLYRAAPMLWSKHEHQKWSVKNVEDFFVTMGRPNVEDINTLMVDEYVHKLKQRLALASVNRKLNSLHKLLKWAVDRDMMEKMPKFNWQKEDNERVRWLSIEEEKQLLSLLPEEISAFCEILLLTGMRRDELRTMKRDQIDGDFARLWKTKTGKARSVPLTPRVKELMDKYVPFNLQKHTIYRAWKKAQKEMGLEHDEDFVLHTLRHTAATRLLDTSKNIVIVQRLLGHAKLTTTSRYAHLSDDLLLQSVNESATNYAQRAITA